MLTYQAVFRNGRLYDLATDQRILLKQEVHVVLIVNSEKDINLVDINIEERPALTSEAQASKVLSDDKQARKVLDKGIRLFFTVNAGVREKGRHDQQAYHFVLELKEDLWVTRKGSKSAEKGVFAPCLCAVYQGDSLPLPKFKSVYANSLNNAYRKVYDLYFSLYGSGSSSIYEKMRTQDGMLLKEFRYW